MPWKWKPAVDKPTEELETLAAWDNMRRARRRKAVKAMETRRAQQARYASFKQGLDAIQLLGIILSLQPGKERDEFENLLGEKLCRLL